MLEVVETAFAEHAAHLEGLRVAQQGARFDYTTVSGNKAARSHVFNLRKVAAAIEATRKAEKAGAVMQFGSGGPASIGHIYGELMVRNMGIKMTHVPYRGGAPMSERHVWWPEAPASWRLRRWLCRRG